MIALAARVAYQRMSRGDKFGRRPLMAPDPIMPSPSQNSSIRRSALREIKATKQTKATQMAT